MRSKYRTCTYLFNFTYCIAMLSGWAQICTANIIVNIGRFGFLAVYRRNSILFQTARLTKAVPGIVIDALSKSLALKCCEHMRHASVRDHLAHFVRTNAKVCVFSSRSHCLQEIYEDQYFWKGLEHLTDNQPLHIY